jgi:hypothetical protein
MGGPFDGHEKSMRGGKYLRPCDHSSLQRIAASARNKVLIWIRNTIG